MSGSVPLPSVLRNNASALTFQLVPIVLIGSFTTMCQPINRAQSDARPSARSDSDILL
jgi:hypothetical protein